MRISVSPISDLCTLKYNTMLSLLVILRYFFSSSWPQAHCRVYVNLSLSVMVKTFFSFFFRYSVLFFSCSLKKDAQIFLQSLFA